MRDSTMLQSLSKSITMGWVPEVWLSSWLIHCHGCSICFFFVGFHCLMICAFIYQIIYLKKCFFKIITPKIASETHFPFPRIRFHLFSAVFVFSPLSMSTKTFMNEFSNITQQVVHWGEWPGRFFFFVLPS